MLSDSNPKCFSRPKNGFICPNHQNLQFLQVLMIYRCVHVCSVQMMENCLKPFLRIFTICKVKIY